MKTLKHICLLPLIFIPIQLLAQQATWELVRENFWGKIAIDPTNPSIIYVSPGIVEQWGLYKSTDGGKNWAYYNTGYGGIEAEGIVIDSNNPQRLWIYGGAFKGVVRSEDGGMTAVRADTGISFDHHGYSVMALAYDHRRDILYAGDHSLIPGGIYRSFDDGQHWELVFAYGSGLIFSPTFFLVEEDSGWIYSGSGGNRSGIWRSKDTGVTWTPLHSQTLAGQSIISLAKVPNSHSLYAAGILGNIYKSYDLGENWNFVTDVTQESDLLTGGLVVSLLDTNYIFVGGVGGTSSGKGGVYMSCDGGKNWQLYHTGLPQNPLGLTGGMWSLTQTPDGKYLYISMRSLINSVYRLPLTTLTSVQESSPHLSPTSFLLHQNYPNPFNAQTRIGFSLMRNEQATLDVLDLKGEQVARLIQGQMRAGDHSIIWNGKNSKGGEVGSGIYLMHMQVGQEVLIRKMLLIR